jgi:hypothetical protein
MMPVSFLRFHILIFCRKEPQKCGECESFYYCDVKCQKEDWKSFHKKECKFVQAKRQLLGEGQKICCQLPGELMLRVYLLIKGHPEVMNEKYLMFDGSERSFADLLAEEGHVEMDADRTKMAISATAQIYPYLFSQDGDLLLLEEIVRKIRINSHFITDCEQNRIGQGISIRASALNHSCRPTAALVFKGDFAEVRVMRDIAVGDEVTVNYMGVLLEKAVRHKELAEKWKFICKCERCEAGDTPEELEGWERLKEIVMNQAYGHKETATQSFKRVLEQATICEKIEGQFNPITTHALLMIAEHMFSHSFLFVEKDEQILLTLMDKLMTAWPITHGSDHRKYPDVLKLNEEVSRKFGEKK